MSDEQKTTQEETQEKPQEEKQVEPKAENEVNPSSEDKVEAKSESEKAEDKESENKDEKKVEVEEIPQDKWQDKIKPGMTVRVHQKIREMNAKGEMKERIQVFEGIVLAHKHGNEPGATIMVRKVSNGVGVEKIFPIHSPNIDKVELVKKAKINRAKLFFLRFRRKKKKRLKEQKID